MVVVELVGSLTGRDFMGNVDLAVRILTNYQIAGGGSVDVGVTSPV